MGDSQPDAGGDWRHLRELGTGSPCRTWASDVATCRVHRDEKRANAVETGLALEVKAAEPRAQIGQTNHVRGELRDAVTEIEKELADLCESNSGLRRSHDARAPNLPHLTGAVPRRLAGVKRRRSVESRQVRTNPRREFRATSRTLPNNRRPGVQCLSS